MQRQLKMGSIYTTIHSRGFTIVELLIVIVVIGILAAITGMAYGGIQNNANDTSIKSDLRNFSKVIELYKVESGTYPTTLTSAMNIKFTKGSYGLDFQGYNARYCYNPSTDVYIMYANSKSGNYDRFIPSSGIESAAATYGWGICQQIGLVNTNPAQNGLFNSSWSSWAN